MFRRLGVLACLLLLRCSFPAVHTRQEYQVLVLDHSGFKYKSHYVFIVIYVTVLIVWFIFVSEAVELSATIEHLPDLANSSANT